MLVDASTFVTAFYVWLGHIVQDQLATNLCHAEFRGHVDGLGVRLSSGLTCHQDARQISNIFAMHLFLTDNVAAITF